MKTQYSTYFRNQKGRKYKVNGVPCCMPEVHRPPPSQLHTFKDSHPFFPIPSVPEETLFPFPSVLPRTADVCLLYSIYHHQQQQPVTRTEVSVNSFDFSPPIMSSSFITAFFILLIGTFVDSVNSEVLFSTLPANLIVTASPKQGEVLTAGVDKITLSWKLNTSLPTGEDGQYKKLKIKLCYAPASQVDRAWRKTNNDLSKDKTCQFDVAVQAYDSATARKGQTVEYTVSPEVPTAMFFIRAYALDSAGKQVAYGQTTDGKKTTNLFDIKGITGRHASLDIAAACFSAFSVLALAVFFIAEKRKTN